jgi:two-component system, sensor histidine kinase PdtaS
MMRQAHDAGALTDCGLPGIGSLPYGAHMCHLYRDRDALVAALVPFFAAGLRANERCVWVTADPLHAPEAAAELRRAGIDVGAKTRRGALEIVEFSEWTLRDGTSLGPEEVCAMWLAEERRALEAGFAGLRISGNVSFLTPDTWDAFMDYEHAANLAFRGRRIVALCTYSMPACGAAGALDIVQRHSCALDRAGARWQVLAAGPA